MAEQILEIKENAKNVEIEVQIDNLVFELYGLDEEEITVVENKT